MEYIIPWSGVLIFYTQEYILFIASRLYWLFHRMINAHGLDQWHIVIMYKVNLLISFLFPVFVQLMLHLSICLSIPTARVTVVQCQMYRMKNGLLYRMKNGLLYQICSQLGDSVIMFVWVLVRVKTQFFTICCNIITWITENRIPTVNKYNNPFFIRYIDTVQL